MVTELLREWSEPLILALLRETAGTAGVTAGLPFTGDDEASFAFCDEDEAPTTAGGWDPVATIGSWADFLGALAAEAYEEAVVAGVSFAGMGFCWLAGDVIRRVRCRFAMRECGGVWIYFFLWASREKAE
jgi:hypothetical protein